MADLATSAMKRLTDEMSSNKTKMRKEISSVKKEIDEEAAIVKPAITFADIVGDNNSGLVLPMKQAIKQIEQEDERKNNVVICGLDLNPDITDLKKQEEQVKHFATESIVESHTTMEDEDVSRLKITIMGKIKSNSGKAPPVLVTMKSPEDARLVLKGSSILRKTANLRNVYIAPDMNKKEREQRKKLVNEFRKKIEEFPEKHWVIRRGVITSIGKYTPRKRLDSEDPGSEFDKSFQY